MAKKPVTPVASVRDAAHGGGPAATARPIGDAARPPPISRFPVGAVGLGESGRVYASVNLEFRGLPLSQSVHAKQFLIANAAAAGESALRAITVSHMPCGHCRQFLQEIHGASGIRIPVTTDVVDGCAPEWRTVASLLIRPIGPHDLLPKHAPLVLPKLYRGVRQRHWGKWVAEIRLLRNRTRMWLVTFDSAEDAAMVYDREVFKLHGENVRLNFLDRFLAKGHDGGSGRTSTTVASTVAKAGRAPASTLARKASAASATHSSTDRTTSPCSAENLRAASAEKEGTEAVAAQLCCA